MIQGHFGAPPNRQFRQIAKIFTDLIEPLSSRMRPTLRDGH
ncbi:MAG: hypothetical protein OJF48_002562 [Afipia sp.]|nr:MAG: hypothetical protein OJF48_002562 [Afipia sp.]